MFGRKNPGDNYRDEKPLLELGGCVGWGWSKAMSLALVLLNLWSPLGPQVGAGAQLSGWSWGLERSRLDMGSSRVGRARRALLAYPILGAGRRTHAAWLTVLREAPS